MLQSTPFRQLESEALSAMTAEERVAFDTALVEEEERSHLAEHVDNPRMREAG